MIIEILSRENIIKYSKKPHNEQSIIISISDMQNEDPKLLKASSNSIIGHLKLNFDDIEVDGKRSMTKEHANTITSFISKFKDKADKIIVNCEAGIRRSAAIAAAIMLHFNGDDWEIFKNNNYNPNILCYKKMLISLNEDIDEILILEKIKYNKSLWEEK